MTAMVYWAALGVAVLILLRQSFVALKPPSITPMSDEWLKHMQYQLTKPGGSMEPYGADADV